MGVYVSESSNAEAKHSTSLLRELHARHLISSRILTSWMGEYLPITNLAQTGFLAQLITTHLPDMVRHIVNARICVRAVCEKIKEVGEMQFIKLRQIRTSPAASSLAKVEASLAYIIKVRLPSKYCSCRRHSLPPIPKSFYLQASGVRMPSC